MDLSLRDRIKFVRKDNNLSQVQFAETLNVTQSVVSLMEAGKASVSVEVLKKISQSFDISCDWLIYGRDKYARLSYKRDFIPLVQKEAKAGYLSKFESHEYLDSLDLYKIPGFEEGEHRIFEVEGNSMSPSIMSRDKVVCLKGDLDELIEGTICVLITSGDILLKRIYHSHQHPKMVVLQSENPNFKNIELNQNEIREIWLVQAKLTNSFTNNAEEQNQRMNDLEKELLEIKSYIKLMLNKFDGSKAVSDAEMKDLWQKDLEK